MLTRALRSRWTRLAAAVSGLLLISATAFASESAAAAIDTGDTAWMLVATALVMMMTAPGLALFYGGLVRDRNVLSTLMHSFFALCIVGVQWVAFGYSLSFGEDVGQFVGNLGHVFMNGVGIDAFPNTAIPHLLFAMFQGMFAIITVGLISGAVAERMSFKAYALFALLWTTLVYDPLAHWVWGGGWLMDLGALDFAGGTVIHISSAVAALVACLMVGKRKGYPEKTGHPHNIPFVLIGGGLLWFGWFGFNAGSALGANGLAVIALTTTHVSAAVAGLTWTLVEWMYKGKPSVVGTVSGAVAGLVAITPAAGFVTVASAMFIGLGAGIFCFLAVALLKARLGYDDTLDVFGVHGVGGIWGALATGLLATTSVNPAGVDGLLYGNPDLLVAQVISILAAVALSGVGTFGILKLVSLVTPLRVSEAEEVEGLDSSLHGEVAYGYMPAPAPSSLPVDEEEESAEAEPAIGND